MEARPRPARLRGAARARSLALLGTLAAGAAIIILGLPQLLDLHDPYAAGADGAAAERWAAGLAVRDQIALKVAHALAEDPYDVGLFGNSRLVAVGEQEVAPFDGRLFNFAVGGTSFLQSVRTFRYLAERGHAPRIAIISLDNFAIGYFGYRYFPGPLWDVQAIVEDAVVAAEGGSGVLDTGLRGARVAAAEVRAAWREFRRQWSADMIELRLLALIGSGSPGPTYRSDGSIAAAGNVLTAQDRDAASSAPDWPIHQRDLLISALGQLAIAAEAAGLTVVVFESPVLDSYLASLREADRAEIETVRAAFFAACDRLAVTCIAAPDLSEDAAAQPWPDCCHAPAALLGSFVGGLLRRAQS